LVFFFFSILLPAPGSELGPKQKECEVDWKALKYGLLSTVFYSLLQLFPLQQNDSYLKFCSALDKGGILRFGEFFGGGKGWFVFVGVFVCFVLNSRYKDLEAVEPLGQHCWSCDPALKSSVAVLW